MAANNYRNINFQGQTIVIVCHDSLAGPPHHTLRDYVIRKKANHVMFIGHQNRYVQNNPVKSSYIEIYKSGHLILRHDSKPLVLPEAIAYVKDFLLTFYWIARYSRIKIDYFIGLGNLNALNGLLLKTIGAVNKTVYYVIDYIPQRFPNIFMNTIYHITDYLCATHSDITWNYAQAMINARNDKWKTIFPRQIVVPNGIFLRKANNLPFSKINRNELVYLGTLYEQQGIELVVEALAKIRKNIRDIQLVVIGIGPLRPKLDRMVSNLDLDGNVKFTGFIKDPSEVDTLVSGSALGLAMYKPKAGFVAYTEPGKVKRYLSCGVPVIMTDVSPLTHEIVRHRCGFCSAYNSGSLTETVVSYLKNPEKMRLYRRNAVNFVKDFEWDKIFDKAFRAI